MALSPLSARAAEQEGRAQQSEEDDYGDTPFTRYGEFNDEEEEAADTTFFQFGRLFGVSFGGGMQGVSGRRGALYNGGFPAVELKVHYWFDFNLAMDLAFSTVQHNYEIATPTTLTGRYQAQVNRLGFDVKYYFDTKDLSAPLSFANPYVLVGAGAFSKSETSTRNNDTDLDTKLGFSLGGGLEFAIRPKKSYFYVEGKLHSVQFTDTSDDTLSEDGSSPRLTDRSGIFYALTAGILFTW